MRGGSGEHDERRAANRLFLGIRGAQIARQWKPREEALILVRCVDRFRDVELEGPHRGVVRVAGQQIGERRSPRTGPNDGAAHYASLVAMTMASTIARLIASVATGRLAGNPRLPKRCSSP